VQDTTFYEKLKPLLREHARGEMPLSQWAEQQVSHGACRTTFS
jgi:hypothetical protein